LPAAAAAAAAAAIGVMSDEPGRQQRVRELARRVRAKLAAAKLELAPGDSPIICVILGPEDRALAAGESLKNQGILVGAVRPPTVAAGSSRLRATLCCEHTDEEVERLISGLIAAASA
jgi:8-amino-7-oxononanoate synthase